MDDFTHIQPGSEGRAVKDVQERLQTLGYNLQNEDKDGFFGPQTAQTVADFRQSVGLTPGTDVDHDTWNALVDATFTFGDRQLYLRMPHFHGRDVNTLQTALAALGFSCNADGIFGAHTERAVREFQQNAGIASDGIVGQSTFGAIQRLHHAWQGKDQLRPQMHAAGFARAAEVLERTSICIYGTNQTTRNVAERISNLALATTPVSRVVCAQSLEQAPDDSMLMIQLTMQTPESPQPTEDPQVLYDSDTTINARMATALGLINPTQPEAQAQPQPQPQPQPPTQPQPQPRIVINVAYQPKDGQTLTQREEQHAAIALLDALCAAYTVQ